MKLLAPLAATSVCVSACLVDLAGLSGEHQDGGLTGGGTTTSTLSTGGSSSGSTVTPSTTASGSGGTGSSTGSTSSTGTGGSGSTATGTLDCGPCPGSGCTPVALATGSDADGPYGIALGSDGLYWVNRTGGTVMRLAATGGAPEVLATASGPETIAVSGGTVVWGAQDGVYACTIASCAATTVEIAAASTMGSISGLAYDGQYVFYGDQGTGLVSRCPLTAGCPGALVLGNTYRVPTGLTLHTTDLLWADQGNGNLNGGVYVSSKGGGTTSTLAGSLGLTTAVVTDGTYFYFTESPATAAKIHRCTLAGGYCQTPDDLVTGLLAPLDLGLGAGRIYWTDTGNGNGTLESCPVAGCGGSAPKVHASGRAGLRRLALGQSCVFWTDDESGGSVSKAAR